MQHDEIIGLWPSMVALASDLNVDVGMVKQWKYRNNIPSWFWVDLVKFALDRGYNINYRILAEAAARNQQNE